LRPSQIFCCVCFFSCLRCATLELCQDISIYEAEYVRPSGACTFCVLEVFDCFVRFYRSGWVPLLLKCF
jgi:hypothetical protein